MKLGSVIFHLCLVTFPQLAIPALYFRVLTLAKYGSRDPLILFWFAQCYVLVRDWRMRGEEKLKHFFPSLSLLLVAMSGSPPQLHNHWVTLPAGPSCLWASSTGGLLSLSIQGWVAMSGSPPQLHNHWVTFPVGPSYLWPSSTGGLLSLTIQEIPKYC